MLILLLPQLVINIQNSLKPFNVQAIWTTLWMVVKFSVTATCVVLDLCFPPRDKYFLDLLRLIFVKDAEACMFLFPWICFTVSFY